MKKLLPLALILSVAACARSYDPVVDMQGVDQVKYQADLEQCRQYAEQAGVAKDALIGTGGGALLGAALGAATGAITGSPGLGAAYGTAAGGIGGLGGGVAHGANRQIDIIKNCLSGRGYRVLG